MSKVFVWRRDLRARALNLKFARTLDIRFFRFCGDRWFRVHGRPECGTFKAMVG